MGTLFGDTTTTTRTLGGVILFVFFTNLSGAPFIVMADISRKANLHDRLMLIDWPHLKNKHCKYRRSAKLKTDRAKKEREMGSNS